MIPDVVKTILPAVTTFIVGILITPFISNFLYKKEMWKKRSVPLAIDGAPATISQNIHNDEIKKTPRMGGIIVWGSVLISVVLICLVSFLFNGGNFSKINFLSRNQTWLPLATLLFLSLFGLIDDYLVCRDKGEYKGGGLSLVTRLLGVFLVACVGAWWFYSKLGYTSIMIPFFGELGLGILFIPLFIITMIAIYSGGIIDGVDGLAGGVFAIMFAAYGAIAFYSSQYDLAAFSMAITGGLLAFLWFNIPPARFFLSETGTMGLTATLVVIAFLTKAVVVLPLIALPLVVTTLSTIIQLLSKKYRNGKKVFKVAPLHNHFQAIGWPSYKVTMRYWIVTSVCAISGVIITLIG